MDTAPVGLRSIPGIEFLGHFGVRIFFVLSGFLITSLLMAERSAIGRISLKNFYLRRVIRIFPAAYVFILIIGAISLTGLLQVSRADFLAACSYTMNYLQPHGWNLGHLWSLAVEEQFYLLWPAALCLVGPRRGLLVAGIFFLIGPCSRYAALCWAPDNIWISSASFLGNADSLASGCLLAGLWPRLGASKRYRGFRQSWAFLTVPLLVAGCCLWGGELFRPLAIALLNVCIALCIDWCIWNRSTVIGRVLNWGPVAFVGVLSYSLYLWQQPLLSRDSPPLNVFPLNLLLVLALAALSYFCVEKQFLKLRHRFAAKTSSPSSPVAISPPPPVVDTPPAAPL